MSAGLKKVTLAANDMAREIERLKIERDELAVAAKRVSASLQLFMEDTTDPGTEALAAQYELTRILSLLSIDENVISEAQYLSRFSATPSEIHRFLASRLPEGVHLNYQRAIGNCAVEEAVRDLKSEAVNPHAHPDAHSDGWMAAVEMIVPSMRGPYPAELVRLGETGGAR